MRKGSNRLFVERAEKMSCIKDYKFCKIRSRCPWRNICRVISFGIQGVPYSILQCVAQRIEQEMKSKAWEEKVLKSGSLQKRIKSDD